MIELLLIVIALLLVGACGAFVAAGFAFVTVDRSTVERATGASIRASNGRANEILRRVGIGPAEELASARSPDELGSLLRRSAEQGTQEAGIAALLQRSR